MLLINVIVELCTRTEEGSQSGAIFTDAAGDVVCFGWGLAIWYLNWSVFPFPPVYLLILDAYIVQ